MEIPSNRILAERLSAGLTRVQLAAQCEVGEATIRRWELSETSIPDEQKLRIAAMLGITPSRLMGWDTEEAAA